MKHYFIPRLSDPNRCTVNNCGSYWNNYVIHVREGDGSRRPESDLDVTYRAEYQDDGHEFRIMSDLLTRDLMVVDRKQEVHATFRPWHAGLAEETMDRLNIRRLAGRG